MNKVLFFVVILSLVCSYVFSNKSKKFALSNGFKNKEINFLNNLEDVYGSQVQQEMVKILFVIYKMCFSFIF